MHIFGWEITRHKKALNTVDSNRGWRTIFESFPGAWQRNVEVKLEDTLSYWAVFRCVSIIKSDIAKLALNLVRQDQNGIWIETEDKTFSPLLRKPNRYQTRIQFVESWVGSKLTHGNTYVLKQRDVRGNVTALYVLDPCRVRALVSDTTGDVFYQLDQDNLSELSETSVVVPADEIIHDRWNTLYHPLVGLSPLYAAGLNAVAGLNIQKNSTLFFGNNSQPGGVLTSPGTIKDETAKRLKEYWENNFSGKNVGKVAVLGDGLKYEAMSVAAKDAQLIEQLKWSAETIAGAFGIPAYMLNIGNNPSYNNIESLTVQYYSQCLQVLIEAFELCLDEGLALKAGLRTQFDLDELLQMDTATRVDVIQKAKGVLTLDEQRKRFNVGPVEGGDTIYLQQQDHSLAAIAARDAMLIEQSENPPQEGAGADQNGGESDSDEERAERRAEALAKFQSALGREWRNALRTH